MCMAAVPTHLHCQSELLVFLVDVVRRARLHLAQQIVQLVQPATVLQHDVEGQP